jgi:hypothetical protein
MYVDDESVDRVTQAARGALILGKDDCERCAAYEEDVRRLQEQAGERVDEFASSWGTYLLERASDAGFL